MPKISKTIVGKLIENGLVEEKDRAVYEYAASVFGCLILPFVFVILLVPFTGLVYEGFIMIIPFTLLRRYCGGFHFQKYQVCFVVSLIYLYVMERMGNLVTLNCAFIDLSLVCLCALGFIGIRKSVKKCPYSHRKRNIEIITICAMLVSVIFWSFKTEENCVARWICVGIIMTFLLQIPVFFFQIINRFKQQVVD